MKSGFERTAIMMATVLIRILTWCVPSVTRFWMETWNLIRLRFAS